MHLMVETARLITYEAAYCVDMAESIEHLKKSGELENIPGCEGLADDLRRYTALARALTPICKYYATEMCNRVAYDALQVLAGSGFMRDYELERFYRDARITTIYEGTTQIQQAAALGSVLKGVLEARFEELHGKFADADPKMLEALAEARGWLKEAVDFANEQDQPFRDLHAGKLVESATAIYCGYLLLEPASRNPHKAALAEHFIAEKLPHVRLARDQVLSGNRTYLDRMPELLK